MRCWYKGWNRLPDSRLRLECYFANNLPVCFFFGRRRVFAGAEKDRTMYGYVAPLPSNVLRLLEFEFGSPDHEFNPLATAPPSGGAPTLSAHIVVNGESDS